MKQVIPFTKNIVFKTKIANITSISLDHEEKIFDGEVSGDFIIYGDYKIHGDTTEKELFKYRLPFTAMFPDNVIRDTVKIDIDDFSYEQVEDDVLKVDISFVMTANECELEKDDRDVSLDLEIDKELDEFIPVIESKEEKVDDKREEDNLSLESIDEYIVYRIHIVSEGEDVDSIIKKYDITMDDFKEYNEDVKIKVGDKLIIPVSYE